MRNTKRGTMRKEAFCSGFKGLLISLAIMMAVALSIPAGAWGTPFAYVTNLSSNTVSVINTATDTVIATVPVTHRPHWVAITPDASRAYVVHDESNQVSVIDADPASPTFNTVVATPSVGASKGIAITPDGSRAYVTNVFWGSVSVLDTDPASPSFHSVVTTIWGLGYAPYGVADNVQDIVDRNNGHDIVDTQL